MQGATFTRATIAGHYSNSIFDRKCMGPFSDHDGNGGHYR